jgi:hypothetical protein
MPGRTRRAEVGATLGSVGRTPGPARIPSSAGAERPQPGSGTGPAPAAARLG